MSNYRRARFENRVKVFLEERGYAVIRAAGSRGITDLWAWGSNSFTPLFIQCKAGRRLPPNTMQNLVEYCYKYNAIPIIAKRGEDDDIVLINLNTGREWTP